MFLMVIFMTIGDVKLYLTYGGIWVENKYHGGNTNMMFVDKTLTVYELLVKVHEIIVCNLDRFVYELVSVFDTDGRVIRLNIKINRDLHYILVETNVSPLEIYVSVQEV